MAAGGLLVKRLGLPEDKPVFPAAVAALVYVVLALLYIFFSSRMAAEYAQSVEQLQAIEAFKGKAFVVVTGLLFFAVSLGWWRTMRDQRRLLVESERRAVASMYSATLAHDLGNVLMGLYGLLDELQKHEDGDGPLSVLRRSAEGNIRNLAQLSKRLASTARQLDDGQSTVVQLSDVLPAAVDLARKHPDVRHCTVVLGAVVPGELMLDTDLFELALMNLIINAAQAVGKDGRIEVVTQQVEDRLSLQVHDNGPGIPPDQREAVFRPGFTTKEKGSGLGMLSVQAFAALCHAKIVIGESPLGGCLVEVVLPGVGQASSKAAENAWATSPQAMPASS